MAGWWHEHQVRERAYTIWEQAGKPHGMEHEHWVRAENEIRAEEAEAQDQEKIKLDE